MLPSRTDWTRLVPPPVLTGHVATRVVRQPTCAHGHLFYNRRQSTTERSDPVFTAHLTRYPSDHITISLQGPAPCSPCARPRRARLPGAQNTRERGPHSTQWARTRWGRRPRPPAAAAARRCASVSPRPTPLADMSAIIRSPPSKSRTCRPCRAVTAPLADRYRAVTAPLADRYRAVTAPLADRYRAVAGLGRLGRKEAAPCPLEAHTLGAGGRGLGHPRPSGRRAQTPHTPHSGPKTRVPTLREGPLQASHSPYRSPYASPTEKRVRGRESRYRMGAGLGPHPRLRVEERAPLETAAGECEEARGCSGRLRGGGGLFGRERSEDLGSPGRGVSN